MAHFLSDDKLSLYYESRVPAEPKAAILFVHGLGEHIGRYRRVFEDFSGRGYSCFGYDQRGFGLSPGVRGHVDSFSYYLNDLDAFIRHVSDKTQGLPVYLFGHSMGAIVVLNYSLSRRPAIQGLLVFSCPLRLGQILSRRFSPIVASLYRFFPRFRVPNMINPKDLTNDTEMLRTFNNDALVEKNVTLNWLHEFTQACNVVKEHCRQITTPTFIAHGGSDHIADKAGVEFLFSRIATDDKKMMVYQGLKHELLNHREADRRKVLEDTFLWLDSHTQSS